MTAAITSAGHSMDASDASFSATPSVTTVAALVPTNASEAAPEHTTGAPVGVHEGAVGTVASTEHHSAEDTGLPQLNTAHWGGQMIWLLIIFAVFYILMAKIFTPRIRKVIDLRGSTIAEDLTSARATRNEAEAQAKQAEAETAEAYASARKMASEALARSNAEVAAATAIEDEKLGKRLAEAETRIRAQRDTAMANVSEIASDTASLLVEKLTGKPATAASLKSALGKA